MGKDVTFHWRYMKLAGFILCLIALFVVCAFPSVAIADEGDDLQFEWDADTRTFTLIYNGTETLEIDNDFFQTHTDEISKLGVSSSATGVRIGTTSEPVEHFVLEGTGPVSWTGTGRIVGMITFDASDGNLISVSNTLFSSSTGTLTSVDFGSNLVELDLSAFGNCSKIENIDLTSCNSLKTITCTGYSNGISDGPSGYLKLPASLESIDCKVFTNGNLTSIEFASGTELKEVTATSRGSLIAGMKNLEKLILPSSLGDYSDVLFVGLSATSVTVEMPYDLAVPEGFFSSMTAAQLNRIAEIVVTCVPSADATNSSLSAEVEKVAEEKSVSLSVEYQLHQVGTDMKCLVCEQFSLVFEELDSGGTYEALVDAAGENFSVAYSVSLEDISLVDDGTFNVQLSVPEVLANGRYVKIFAYSQETGNVSLVGTDYVTMDGQVSFEVDSLADAYAVAVMGNGSGGYVTVTFNGNGGTYSSGASYSPSAGIYYGNTVPQPSILPVANGHSLTGWYTDPSCTEETKWDFSTPVFENMTLYAGWDPPIIDAYTVTFDTRSDSTIDSQTVSESDLVEVPENPVRDGYTFAGWYTDADCTEGNEFSFDTPVTESLTLYAKWVENSSEDEGSASDTENPSGTEDSGDTEDSSDTENSGATEDSSDTENSGDEAEDLTDDPDDSSADQEDDATDSMTDPTVDSLFTPTGDLPQTGDNSLASYGLLGLIATLAACGGVFAYRNLKTTSTRDK